MRTLIITDMEGYEHEIDIVFVEDLVRALDESRLLDDVIQATPVARVKKALEPYVEKEKQHG